MNDNKVGLALGAGAARGIAHIPIIRGLRREGVEIAEVSGASIGAIIGAYYALHMEVDSLLKIIMGMRKIEFLKLMDLKGGRLSIIRGDNIRRFMKRIFGNAAFRHTKIPLSIAATDILRQKPLIIKDGLIVDAIMASIALPGILPPVRRGNTLLVDGGVLLPVPIESLSSKKIIAVNLLNNTSYLQDKKNMVTVITLSLSTMMKHLVIPRDNVFYFNPSFRFSVADSFKFYRHPYFLGVGQREFRKRREDLKRFIKK